ncbi:YbhB/YbcL family Raf kinase inhibitor-like protein [Microbacterium sp.]|uniref:YbhB/YbcL family Raf kinase inhibitor-like protein n=1 Tax=Microbacterium sp. TaxID=51671 RepID=UPI0039E4BEC0
MFSYNPYAALAELRPIAPLELTSPDFEAGGRLPLSAWSTSRGGDDLAPRLQWSDPPAGTKSLALSCFDPDAPTGSGYWHWAVFDLPAGLRALDAGDGSTDALPDGARVLPNEERLRRFIGAAPPAGTGVHRYFFVIDALDVPALEIDADATPAVLGFNRHFHALARGILVGTADPTER